MAGKIIGKNLTYKLNFSRVSGTFQVILPVYEFLNWYSGNNSGETTSIRNKVKKTDNAKIAIRFIIVFLSIPLI